MDALTFTAEQGLWGVLIGSFLSATVLPGGSEALLYGFVQAHPADTATAIFWATVGNTFGGMTSWACGRYLPRWQKLEKLPHLDAVRRWGSAALLLSWVPLIGDALCIAAGWLRLHWLPCLLCMAIGKAVRYAVVAGLA